ncbi:Uncharacterised protein [Chlamydia trachomatis]|nr:Uncharacterised protein [Chlamydia trachomatis]
MADAGKWVNGPRGFTTLHHFKRLTVIGLALRRLDHAPSTTVEPTP